MTRTVVGMLAEHFSTSWPGDLHGVEVRLAPLDCAVPPWRAVAHVVAGRGDAARDAALALRDSLELGRHYRVTASAQYVDAMTIHLLGDVRIEPADDSPATPPDRGPAPPAPQQPPAHAAQACRPGVGIAAAALMMPLASIAVPALCWIGSIIAGAPR